jgi:Mrp family chromosome partitioning ATPase
MNTADHLRWRTSRRSGNGENCVQLAVSSGGVLVRDSKNPTGPVLRADLATLLAEVKSGRLDF